MSVVVRGAKNAFRNGLRTAAVVLILAISIGLSLSMLVANKAVEGRIDDLKKQVDRTITINPAGSRGMDGGGEPLTNDDLAKVQNAAHVETASAYLNVMLTTDDGTDNSNFMIKMRGGNGKEPGKTNLESSIEAGTLGKRFNANTNIEEDAPDIKLPIRGIAANGNYDASGKLLSLTDGRLLNDGDNNGYNAVVGKNLAEKNSLKVGSTFTAYDKTFTVVGIVDQGTQYENDLIIFPLETMQMLMELPNEVSAIVARADSFENLETAMNDIQSTLGGEDKVDVTISQQNIQDAIASLKSVQNISIIGFITALTAAGLIVLMVMFVIVRERCREIGVLKAIGGSNRSIVSQFVVEAVVLVAVGGVLGLGTAFVSSGAIANALVSNNVSSSTETTEEADTKPRMGGGIVRIDGSGKDLEDTSELVGEVTTSIGVSTLLYGFLGMIAIAILGSAIPAWLIAKVRPAEVLRGE